MRLFDQFFRFAAPLIGIVTGNHSEYRPDNRKSEQDQKPDRSHVRFAIAAMRAAGSAVAHLSSALIAFRKGHFAATLEALTPAYKQEMATNGFDTSLFNRQINQVFGEYLQFNRRSRPLLVQEQADKLAVQLQIEASKEGPRTRAEINALPIRLGYRIRRRLAKGLSKNPNRRGNKSLAATIERGAAAAGRKHVTVAEEIRLRLRWAGFYQASGWITYKLTLSRGRTRIRNPRGKIVPSFVGGRPVITLINQTPGALEFAVKTGYIERALRNRISDMRVYIQRKMREQAAEFSRPKPNFQRAA